MKEFEPKRKLQVSEINSLRKGAADFIKDCEASYTKGLDYIANEILKNGCHVVMASGPSASGKTTSSQRLAKRLRELGAESLVISMDDFFKNLEDYPLNAEGKPDLESVYALDIELVNKTVAALLRDGRCELPQFDFKTQSRREERIPISLGKHGVAIIEGIHALNPLLTSEVGSGGRMGLYIGLREEYYEGERRVVATRDLRISRRLVRDLLFRGYSVEQTLSVWDGILHGEEKWIKPTKPFADFMLDTSLSYEPCVFSRILRSFRADEECGGVHRARFIKLCENFERFDYFDFDSIPANSILREFIGGLVI